VAGYALSFSDWIGVGLRVIFRLQDKGIPPSTRCRAQEADGRVQAIPALLTTASQARQRSTAAHWLLITLAIRPAAFTLYGNLVFAAPRVSTLAWPQPQSTFWHSNHKDHPEASQKALPSRTRPASTDQPVLAPNTARYQNEYE
jgi:hypothetical protein